MIWLIGNNGMLGHEIDDLLVNNKFSFVATDIELDITNLDGLRQFAAGKNISWIINCSAYTAVDNAEDDSEKAYCINEAGAGNLAIIANEVGAKLIHISTDYVFDGESSVPYKEGDATGPQGVYGASKLAGEKAISQSCKDFFIIRTAWLYGKYGKNFVSTMLNLMKEKPELKVVDDQVGSPTYAGDLAKSVAAFISADSKAYGIYHFSNAGKTSWYSFALKIQEYGFEKGLLDKQIPVHPVTSDKFPTKAVRPKFSLLDKTKIKNTLQIEVPEWEDSLKHFIYEDVQ